MTILNLRSDELSRSSYWQSPSVPGLALILDERRRATKRLFWTLLLLVLGATSVFQVTDRLERFHHHPVESVVDFVFDKDFRFPHMTLCADREREDEPMRPPPDVRVNCVYNLLDNCTESVNWKHTETALGTCLTLDLDLSSTRREPILPTVDLTFEIVEDLELTKNGDDQKDVSVPLSDHQWRVLLHGPALDVTYPVARFGYHVTWGHTTFIGYEKRLYKFENTHQRPCAHQKVHNACLAACFDRQLAEQFKCRAPFMVTVSSGEPDQLPDEVAACNASVLRRLYWQSSQAAYVTLERDCGCDWPCGTTFFDAQLDTRRRPEPEAGRRWSVSLSPLKHTALLTRERCSYGFFVLMCDIGATIGLYLGVTLPALVELAVELLSFVAVAIGRRLPVTR